MKNIEMVLEKVAEELESANDVLTAEDTLVKIAFAKKALEISKNNEENFEKTAAPSGSVSREALNGVGGTLARALVAGVGLGLAGELIGEGHKKVKKLIFDSKLDHLTKEVQKQSPELKNTNKEQIKTLLRAGYTLAPDVIQNPTLAASFVSIGNSLGGKIDPNTMKIFAETQNKTYGSTNRNPLLEALPDAGNVL